jgi:hypothetical protein
MRTDATPRESTDPVRLSPFVVRSVIFDKMSVIFWFQPLVLLHRYYST